MKHEWTTAILSFILLVLPFLGFPASVDYTLLFIIGLFFFFRSMLALKHHYSAEADKAAALLTPPSLPVTNKETNEGQTPQAPVSL